MQTSDDMSLVREFAGQQNEAAFEALVTRHVNLVYSAALRQVGDAHTAEEVTQAVFIILARKAGSLRRGTFLTGWLFKTTRYAARAELRARVRRLHRETQAYMDASQITEEEAWPQIAPLLDEALANLGETDRRAVLLRYFERKTLAEVGATLGVNEDAARKRVDRGLEKLRKLFGKRGVTLTATMIASVVGANSVQAAPSVLAKSVTAAAITKGIAASGSTITLIKGALKIMAWTKAKMAVAVGVGVLLTAGTATVVVSEFHNNYETNDPVWNDDVKALEAAPPMVILRATKFPANRAGGILINGKLAIRCQPAKELLVHAFNWSPVKMIINTELPTGRFDYLVTLPENQEAALQQKIREKFHIVGRHEMRDTLVYIVKGKPAPELKPLRSAEGVEQIVENGHYKGPMSAMWYTLEYYLKTPVLPEMEAAPDCAVDFRWGNSKDKAFPEVPDVTALQKALREQLDLELIATNRPIETLVVEKVK